KYVTLHRSSRGSRGRTDEEPKMPAARRMTGSEHISTLIRGYRFSAMPLIENVPSPSSSPASHATSHSEPQRSASIERSNRDTGPIGLTRGVRPARVAFHHPL